MTHSDLLTEIVSKNDLRINSALYHYIFQYRHRILLCIIMYSGTDIE